MISEIAFTAIRFIYTYLSLHVLEQYRILRHVLQSLVAGLLHIAHSAGAEG